MVAPVPDPSSSCIASNAAATAPVVAASVQGDANHDASKWCVVGSNGRPITPTRTASYAGAITSGQHPFKPAEPIKRRITGTRVSTETNSTLSSAAPKAWHLFIGRFKKDTGEGELKAYLEENKISVVKVRKLKATKSWQEKSDAFRVSVALTCKDSVMDPDLWPDNIEVRDWRFKTN